MPIEEHRREASQIEVKLCLLITSDSISKGIKKDEITPIVEKLTINRGLLLARRVVVPNVEPEIKDKLSDLLNTCNVIIVTGGTGISPRDITVESLKNHCTKELPGFGELFRYLTFSRHGSAAIASRSFACVMNRTLTFVVPGSPDAVELALRELILPEARHLVHELSKE